MGVERGAAAGWRGVKNKPGPPVVGVDFGLMFLGPLCPCWLGDEARRADVRAVKKPLAPPSAYGS